MSNILLVDLFLYTSSNKSLLTLWLGDFNIDVDLITSLILSSDNNIFDINSIKEVTLKKIFIKYFLSPHPY
jgi:hypothetical protein